MQTLVTGRAFIGARMHLGLLLKILYQGHGDVASPTGGGRDEVSGASMPPGRNPRACFIIEHPQGHALLGT